MAFLQIGVLALCFLLYKFITSFIAKRRFNAFAERNGCQKAHNIGGIYLIGGFLRLKRVLDMKKNGEDLLDDILTSDFEHAWTVRFKAFDGNTVHLTVEPANLQAMLATQFKDFEVGARRYNVFKPLIGRSIFSSDGAFWEHSRALFRPQFSRENINDLEMTEKASTDLIKAIGDTNNEGWTSGTEMLPLLYNFTLDTATDFLFGQSVESQQVTIAARSSTGSSVKAQDEEAKAFAKAFGTINEALVTRIRLQSLYWLGDGFELRRAIKTIRNFTAPIVQRSIDAAASSSKREEKKKQSLITNLATQTQDKTELRNQTMAILLAGRDTTSSLLGWAFIRLALHPDIFSKLRSVVLQDFQPGKEITFARLKGCRYLQHFLSEVLRLHPTVPLNQRSAARDTTLPTGGGPDGLSPIAIRKGQMILFSVYIMQRRIDLWGPDAADFKPERWEQRIPAWQFLPFSGGPRICLGQQFALTEAGYLIVRMLREFDTIAPIDPVEMQKMNKGLGVTMWPGDAAKVRFRKASTAS